MACSQIARRIPKEMHQDYPLPLAARRQAKVTERRTAKDFAYCLRDLADIQYPNAEKIVIVTDSLNTRSLYAAF